MTGARTVLLDDPPDDDQDTVLVAVANPATVEQLLRTAGDLAAARDGEVLAVSVVHKPLSSPFLLFSGERIRHEYGDDHVAVLDRAVAAGGDGRVAVRRQLLVGSDVSEAILQTAGAADAAALLLGWQDRSRPSDIVLGQTVDRLVARAPCPVYVERVGATADGVERVLLPTVGGPHLQAAATLVAAIAAANGAAVTVASYVPPADERAERKAAVAAVETAADHLDTAAAPPGTGPIQTVVEAADDPAEAILAAAADHDVVVLGATRERGLRRPVVGSVARTVAAGADPPVIVARRPREPSLLERFRLG